MVEDSKYFAAGVAGFILAATILITGFAMGEIFEIVVLGAVLLLICPGILALPALRE